MKSELDVSSRCTRSFGTIQVQPAIEYENGRYTTTDVRSWSASSDSCVMKPSARIAPGFGLVTLELKKGQKLNGILQQEKKDDNLAIRAKALLTAAFHYQLSDHLLKILLHISGTVVCLQIFLPGYSMQPFYQ